MTSTGNGMTLFTTDPALHVRSSRRYLIWAVLGFAFYLACVIGGSMLQGALDLGLEMGWGQQILSAIAVLFLAMFMKDRKSILAWRWPEPFWLRWSVIAGLAIAVAGLVVGLAIGEQPQRHGIEYFAYEATMPGLAEELGFRGLLFGCLLAAFGSRPKRHSSSVLQQSRRPYLSRHCMVSKRAASGFWVCSATQLLPAWCLRWCGSRPGRSYLRLSGTISQTLLAG